MRRRWKSTTSGDRKQKRFEKINAFGRTMALKHDTRDGWKQEQQAMVGQFRWMQWSLFKIQMAEKELNCRLRDLVLIFFHEPEVCRLITNTLLHECKLFIISLRFAEC